jgi:hypothetical protein
MKKKFREKITMKIRMITAAAAIALVAIGAAGCGTSAPHAASPQSTAAPQSAALSTCTIYAQQHYAEVTVTPGDKGECDGLIKDLATGDAFWSYTPNQVPGSGLSQMCDMTSPDGTYEAVVQDGGEDLIAVGQDVCRSMASGGWTTSQQPGPLAQQIAQQAAQQQQAQASASAAAATQQQIAGLQSSLQSDVSRQAQDAASLDSDTSLSGDISSIKSDLATEQKDYATVQSDDCTSRPGDAGTVDGDSGTVDGDLGTIQGDISSLQANSVGHDISTVQGDVSQLQSLGASPDTDPTAALAAGHKALKDMNAAISWAQQQASALDGQAHQIAKAADALANGC